MLLGPLGAALGVLTGKGQQVLFELTESDGTRRKGIVAQQHYGKLRLAIERMQTYRTGDLGKNIASIAGFVLLVLVCVAATGAAGLLLAPLAWFGGGAIARRIRGRRAAA